MSTQHPEVGSEVVPLEAAGFDMALLDQTRIWLEECKYEVLDGFVERDARGPHGKIEVRPPLSPEARMKLSRALGVMTTARASRNLAA